MGRFMQRAANRDYSKEWQAPGSLPWLMQRPKEPIETGLSAPETTIYAVSKGTSLIGCRHIFMNRILFGRMP